MMIRVTVDEMQAKLKELLDAAVQGEEVVVTIEGDEGTREVRMVALSAGPRGPRFGSAKGLIWSSDDFEDPLPDFEDYQ